MTLPGSEPASLINSQVVRSTFRTLRMLSSLGRLTTGAREAMAVSNFAAMSDVDFIVAAVGGTLAGYVAPLIVVAHRRQRGSTANRGSEPSNRKKKHNQVY